jgi:hypothetical protein
MMTALFQFVSGLMEDEARLRCHLASVRRSCTASWFPVVNRADRMRERMGPRLRVRSRKHPGRKGAALPGLLMEHETTSLVRIALSA